MLPSVFFCRLKLSIEILRHDFLREEIISIRFSGKGEMERLIIQRFLLSSEFQKPGVLLDIFKNVKCI